MKFFCLPSIFGLLWLGSGRVAAAWWNGRGGSARLVVSMRARCGGERGMIPLYVPKTENQKRFVSALDDDRNKLVVVLGPAGTGKTLFACLKAIRDLKAGVVSKIVITRPVVGVEEELGFLPGSVRNKMDPWMRPIFDVFLEFYSQRDLDGMIQSGVIEISPLAFMRGRTFKRCFVLADEMQNSSPNQMLMLTTRLGDGSRMVVGGDLNQSDRGSGENGLADFVLRFRRFLVGGGDSLGVAMCEMDGGDVERSPIVSKVLEIMTGISERGFVNKPIVAIENKSVAENKTILTIEDESVVENFDVEDSAIIPKKDFYSKHKPIW